MRPLLHLVPLLLVPLLAGCSGSVSIGENRISGEEIAKQIRPEYVAQTDLELRELTCADVDGEKGAQINCTGENEKGVELAFAGAIIETTGSKGRFRWKIVKADAPGRLYEQAAATSLTKISKKPVAAVDCPERIEVAAGAKVRCEARAADGETAPVELTLKDGDGGFSVRFLDAG